ncbi:MAG TPA: hypothetical protein VFT95_11035, partial [Micromonosporaceae bacterium]|nr:hypothetical protein [Micromonosporaceae bacterium]
MATTVSAGAARLADAGTPASLRRDPVLLGLLGLGAVLALWYASDLGGAAAHVRVFWVVQFGMDFGFVLFSARIARLAAVPRATRRFWRFITVGGALFFAGDAVQTIVTLAHPDPTATAISPVQLVLLGLGAACCVLAMLTHPAKITGRGRLRFALDAGTIMAGATIFVWYFQLGTQSTGDRAGLGMVAVTSALMLVATFGLVKLLFGGNPPFTRRAGILGGLATALSAVTTGLGAALADTAHPDLRFVVQLLPCFLIVATPRVQELQVRADPGVLNRARTRPYNLLPYGAVGAVQALLVLALLSGDLTVRT